MPRQARIDAPGALHHIICRGIERRAIFRDNVDRDDFVSRLSTILSETSTRCFAWALIPNHLHLLLQTGKTPIAHVMRRLLTGYSVKFNRRHNRHGHLFQNRYKSILCQEEPYLLELVRYLHLNPLRAGIVATLEALADFPYCGHGCVLGKHAHSWQAADEVLEHFGKRTNIARKNYLHYVAAGIEQGRRPDLVGGGLVRSAGGWQSLASLRQERSHQKSDERILGDSAFVESVLRDADEAMKRQNQCRSLDIDLETMVLMVAEKFGVTPEDIWKGGKQPKRVAARSLLSFWAVKGLGRSATEIAGWLGLSQSSVSRSVPRGEVLARKNGWNLEEEINA
ncbi:transposase of ISPca5, Y1_Tnp domain-containing [Syntrophotalea carbinolica DSM 2380]|uniref:Transposase of ISPca5, Y1_Tnp domain-containing n=1 Tax=Syntrophotalea carbinolica (strain DSM 2380 / NBRC 103641 / GraBd1) TaxID=338963 RepID=Q3A5M4_SYNC1|nr:transposase [Syntrophotalea carbinolica]ABA88333.1 transposase of ISPca5, Y1_Tnp domain-containing [Syntrophotalea carbinolica DSM 2380]